MGTSSNQRSPQTPNWSIPRSVIGRKDVNIERQSCEIWKAALADRDGKLLNELSHPLIANLSKIAGKSIDPLEAIREYDKIILKAETAHLIHDLAKRAIVRCVAKKTGTVGFASELFSEVVSYYASRDLPSFVGRNDRISNPLETIRFKKSLQEISKFYAASIKPRTDEKGWKDYIAKVTFNIIHYGNIE